MFGLFNEHGPFVIADQNASKVNIREYAWTKSYSILYIDNPVGTGFSFTNDDKGYATNETQVADDLYEGLEQFFTVFDEYSKNDFYVTGESYAGKYVPAIAYRIYKSGSKAKMNLKGIAIGDGLCEPETMFDYSDYLYQIGLLDEKERDFMANEQQLAVNLIREGKFFEAFKIFDLILNGDLIHGQSFFKNATGLEFYFNFLLTEAPKDFGYYS